MLSRDMASVITDDDEYDEEIDQPFELAMRTGNSFLSKSKDSNEHFLMIDDDYPATS